MRRFVSITAAALLLAALPVLAGPDEAPAKKAGGMVIPADAATVTLKDTDGKLVLELGGEWTSLPEPARKMVLETLKERLSEAQLKHALRKLVAGERKILLATSKPLDSTTRHRVIATLKGEVRPEIEEEIEIEIEQCGPMIEDEPAIGKKSCEKCSGDCGCGTAGDVVDEEEIQKAIEEALVRLKEMKALEGSIRGKVIELKSKPGGIQPDRIVISGGKGDVQILTTDKDGRFHIEGVPLQGKHVIRAKTDRDGSVRIFGRDGKEIGVEGDRLKTIRGRIVGPGGHHVIGEERRVRMPPKTQVKVQLQGNENWAGLPPDVRQQVLSSLRQHLSPEMMKSVLKSLQAGAMAAPKWPVRAGRPLAQGGMAGRRMGGSGPRGPARAAPRAAHNPQSALIHALEALRQEIHGLRQEVRAMRGAHSAITVPGPKAWDSTRALVRPKPPVPPAPVRAPMIRMAPGTRPKAPQIKSGTSFRVVPGKLHVTPKIQGTPHVVLGMPKAVPAAGQMEAKLKKLYAQVAEQKAMIHTLMKRLAVLEAKLDK